MLFEGYFDKIYYRFLKTEKDSDVIANIFAIHGLGGHSLWFDRGGELFNKQKIDFFSFDLPGFGQSKYPIGTVESYKLWISATREILEKFLVTFDVKTPVFILGHSMGGLIAILLSKEVRANGWIISVPGFEGYHKTWPLINFIFPVLVKSVFSPKKSIILPFGPELLTKNRETQLKVKKDPLRVTNPNAKIFLEVYLLTLASKLFCDSLTEPVLMLQAGQDKVCSNNAMVDYFIKIQSKDKVKIMYESSYHDLFIEDELNEIVSDISFWVRERV